MTIKKCSEIIHTSRREKKASERASGGEKENEAKSKCIGMGLVAFILQTTAGGYLRSNALHVRGLKNLARRTT